MAADLSGIRARIDAIDPQIRELLMQRMDCSRDVAHAKLEAGETTIYRADREEAILKRLGEGVPDERLAGYLAVVRKIMEASRMYQYGLMYEALGDPFSPLAKGLDVKPGMTWVKVRFTRPDTPGSMASILGMIGDYGFNMERMEQLEPEEAGTAAFELTIRGDLSELRMKRLMFQLSRECGNFKILACG
jgi:chorismate mutase